MKWNPIYLWLVVACLTIPSSSLAKEGDLPMKFPTPEKSQAYTADELQALDRALANLNMTRRDLEFNKDAAPSRFTLPLIKRLLKKPLDNPIYGQWAAGKMTQASPDDLVDLTFRQLNHVPSATGFQPISADVEITPDLLKQTLQSLALKESVSPETLALASNLPPSIQRLLVDFATTGAEVRNLVKKAFSRLSKGERLILRQLAPTLVVEKGYQPRLPAKLMGQLQRKFRGNFTGLILHLASKVNSTHLARAGVLWTGLARRIDGYLEKTGRNHWKKCRPVELAGAGPVFFHMKTKYGRLVIGSRSRNIYSHHFSFVIDPGGDDLYLASSGGTGTDGSMALVVDGGGADIYRSRTPFSLGSALMGVAVLWDRQGSDDYRSGYAGQGAAIFGMGLLYDGSGTDTYRTVSFGQGAAIFGVGVLLDDQPKGKRKEGLGNDRYHTGTQGQGFSQTMGLGLLLDRYGNDIYAAGGVKMHRPLYNDRYQSLSQGFSIGFRRHRAAGGLAFLIDETGNDRYLGEVYGQGASYWYGAGFLYDGGGNDSYNLTIYGQGSGIHLSVGTLIDEGGHDSYTLDNGLGQGGAHDYGVGILVDRGGNDRYTATSGAQGCGLTNSVGILIDRAGNDLYSGLEDHVQGGGRPARGTGSIGIIVDMAGKDRYSHGGKDGLHWTGNRYGTGVDVSPSSEKPVVLKKPDKTAPSTTSKVKANRANFGRLFRIASLWQVGKNKQRVAQARREITSWGTAALPFLQNRFNRHNTLHTRALDEILLAIAGDHKKEVAQVVLGAFEKQNYSAQVNALRLAAKLDLTEAGPLVIQRLGQPRLRRYACSTAGKLKLKKAVPHLTKLLAGPRESQIISALSALSQIGDGKALPAMIKTLEHPYFTVRSAAVLHLARMGKVVAPAMAKLAQNPKASPSLRVHALQVLVHLKEGKDLNLLSQILPLFEDKNPQIRAYGVMAVASFPSETQPPTVLEKLAKKERDPFVRFALEQAGIDVEKTKIK